MTDPFYRVPVRVHWADTDAAGIVWFGNFFRFFEEAETALFLALGRNRSELMADLGILLPRVEASCVFRAPARPEQLLDIGVAVAEISARRITYRFEARDHASRRVLAHGSYRIACVRRDSFTAIAVPDPLRDLLRSSPSNPECAPGQAGTPLAPASSPSRPTSRSRVGGETANASEK